MGDSMNREIVDGTSVKSRAKFDLPTPLITNVKEYADDVKGGYEPPHSYIRFDAHEAHARLTKIEYIMDEEDKAWLNSFSKGGKYTLTADVFEKMIRLLEHLIAKKGGTGADLRHDQYCLTVEHAEEVFFSELNWVGTESAKLVERFRNYWLTKRSQHKKPLIRQYWPQTAVTDTNPHMVFRAREKERYKLRKTRRNDRESFERMKKLRDDLESSRKLLRLLKEREEIKQFDVNYHNEIFLQGIHEMIHPNDITGKKRKISCKLRPKRKRKKVTSSIQGDKLILKLKLKSVTLASQEATAKALAAEKLKAEENARELRRLQEEEEMRLNTIPMFMHPTFAPTVYHKMPGATFPDIPMYSSSSSETFDEHNSENYINSVGELQRHQVKASNSQRYICRPRIARGNRIVIDRLPWYRYKDEVGLGRSAVGRFVDRIKARQKLEVLRKERERIEMEDASDSTEDSESEEEDTYENSQTALGINKYDFKKTKCVLSVGGAAFGGRGLWGWGRKSSGRGGANFHSPLADKTNNLNKENAWWDNLGLGDLPNYEVEQEQTAREEAELQKEQIKKTKKQKKKSKTKNQKLYARKATHFGDPSPLIYEPTYARPYHRTELSSDLPEAPGKSLSNVHPDASTKGTSLSCIDGVVNRAALEYIYMLSDSEDDTIEISNGSDDINARYSRDHVKYLFNFDV